MGRWAIINAILGLLVLLLGVEIARTWTRSLPVVEVAARPSAPTPAPEKRDSHKRGGAEKGGARADQTPATLVAAIVDKDLFDQSRQKPVEDAKGAAAASVERKVDPPTGVTLVGISIVSGEREAYVLDANQQNQQRRLHVGDQISGYTVRSIDVGAIQLVSPSNDPVPMPLLIEKKGGPGAPGAPPRPPVAARPGVATASPAAGITQGASPAAGVGAPAPAGPPRPGVPAPAAPVPPQPPAAAAAAQLQQRMQRMRERQLGRRH
ncbi:MAG TPA: hypothetical protein VKZ18_03470 [Polyangia bacterium]|nr:hypothetical protein [Polyangia bacterium]